MTTLVLIARVGNQRIAFEAAAVEAVVDLSAVVPVPQGRAHVLGLSAIRSQIVTVIDAAAAVDEGTSSPVGRAVIVQIEGHRYAVRVNAVDDVVAHSVSHAAATELMSRGWSRVTLGCVDLGKEFALLIDPAQLIVGPLYAIAA